MTLAYDLGKTAFIKQALSPQLLRRFLDAASNVSPQRASQAADRVLSNFRSVPLTRGGNYLPVLDKAYEILPSGITMPRSVRTPIRNAANPGIPPGLRPGIQGPAPPAPPPVRHAPLGATTPVRPPAPPAPPPIRGSASANPITLAPGANPTVTARPLQRPGSTAATSSFSAPATQSVIGGGGSTQKIPPVSVKQNWRGQTAQPTPPAVPPTPPPVVNPSDPGLGPNGLPIINTNVGRRSPSPSTATPGGRGMFESLGAGADTLTSGARQLGSDAASLYGRSLAENPITTLGWTGALGVPAAGGVMEGLSALGQYTGMSNPSGNSWYAPHMSSLRFDPNVVGEGSALMNRMTSPFQYLSYLSGNQEGPTGVQQLEGYNPTTGTIGSGGLNANNLKVDPATGRVTLQGEFAPGLNPAIRQQMESRRQLVERLAPQFGFGRQSNKTIPSSRETYNGPLLQVGDT